MAGAGSAQSAVGSLLGTLATVITDEAKLLGGVRGDVQFIKDEMESMNGFLLDVADAGRRPSNQARAWMRQVRDVAYDSQNCIDRYVQTMGASRPSAGLLGSVRQAPRLVRTMPDRHRLATELRELRSRAREVGERRQRYGVKAATVEPPPADRVRVEAAAAAEEEEDVEEDARRRQALDLADADLFGDDKLEEWMVASLDRQSSFLNWMAIFDWEPESSYDELVVEMLRFLIISLSKTGRRKKQVDESRRKVKELLPQLTGPELRREMMQHSHWMAAEVFDLGGDKEEERKEEQPPPPLEDAEELIRCVMGLFRGGARPPVTVLPIVAPSLEDGAAGEAEAGTTGLARRLYDRARAGWGRFGCTVWVDARLHSRPRQRLECILQQVHPQQIGNTGWDGWDDRRLEQEIARHLEAKGRFMIVLADHEDLSPWADIANALPPGDHLGSVVIVTPFINKRTHLHGWYIANSLMHLKLQSIASFSALFRTCLRRATRMAPGRRSSPKVWENAVNGVLWKCHWDTFSCKMFLHALHADPRISTEDLEGLKHTLRDSSIVGNANARKMIRFCYTQLPSHYKTCFLYLSIFPQDKSLPIRRTSLVRRWVAENLITRRHELSALEEAERCFDELIVRGLVLAHSMGADGRVKTCKVHPHVSSFITLMAQEENIAGNTGLQPKLACRLSIRHGIQLQQLAEKPQATPTCWRLHKHKARNGPLEVLLDDDMLAFLNLVPASSQLGLVKVLDLEGCKGLKRNHLKNICNKLFQLRFLSLRNTDATELPKEIEKLRYLQTFDIRQTKVESFPGKAIVMLQKLVHLLAGHIGSDGSFSTIHLPHHGVGSMTNMQILSHIEVSDRADERQLIEVGRLHQLKKLGVVIHGNEAHLLTFLLRAIGKLNECLCSLSVRIETVKDGGVFRSKRRHVDGDEADDMTSNDAAFSPPKSLTSLSINGWISGLPTWIKELQKLSKITLSGTYLTDTDIEMLGQLVKLRCLRLRRNSYIPEKLIMKEKRFQKLEFLVVEGTDITFEQSAAPMLVKIVWTPTNTANLYGIQNLQSLKKIELSGDCDTRFLKEAISKHPNRPILTHIPGLQ